MASRPRLLTSTESREIAAAIRPLVERFSQRFGVAPSAVLRVVQQATPARIPSLPTAYVPKHPVLARLIAAAVAATDLSPGSIIEDEFDAPRTARDAVIYVARSAFDLPYETIGRVLNNMPHEAVMDGYCRALGHLEHANKDFHTLTLAIEKGGRRR